MKITGKYFAMGYLKPDGTPELALTVERDGEPGFQVQGFVINGAWRGRFSDHDVTVNVDRATFPAALMWQGDQLTVNHEPGFRNDYGFSYVQAEVDAGRTGLTDDVHR